LQYRLVGSKNQTPAEEAGVAKDKRESAFLVMSWMRKMLKKPKKFR
jgi:hypothetical protein